MKRNTNMKGYLRLILLFLIAGLYTCSGERRNDRSENSAASSRPEVLLNQSFFGWESVALHNNLVRLDIVPDLGGKIMGFEFQGSQIIWHDRSLEGRVDRDQGYGRGGNWRNPGGAKVWPAPQGRGESQWPGPPDDVLDSGIYEYTAENNAVTVISLDDDAEGRSGLRYTHTYSLVPDSTVVGLNLTMTNIVDRKVKWSLWQLSTLPVDRPFTITVPIDEGQWYVMFGDEDNPQWEGIRDGLFHARYQNITGKVGMSAREGWAAWHDDQSQTAFVMLFEIDDEAEYPDRGSQVEIWMLGSDDPARNNVELEVLGPLEELAPGESAALNIQWGVCRCSAVKKAGPAGVIAQEPRLTGGVVEGTLGVFYRGILQALYRDTEGREVGSSDLTTATPTSEIRLAHRVSELPAEASTVVYRLLDKERTVIGDLAEIPLK